MKMVKPSSIDIGEKKKQNGTGEMITLFALYFFILNRAKNYKRSERKVKFPRP